MEEIDKELEEAEKIARMKGNVIVAKSYTLTWWERNFTSKNDDLRNELNMHWQNFGIWQDIKLREKSRLLDKELQKLFTPLTK